MRNGNDAIMQYELTMHDRPSVWIVYGLPVVCAIGGCLLLGLQRFIAPRIDRSYLLLHIPYAFILICIYFVGECCLLFGRYRHPFGVLILESLSILPACVVGLDSWVIPLLLIAEYVLILRTSKIYMMILGTLVAAVASLIPMFTLTLNNYWTESFPRVLPVIVIAVVALTVRNSRLARATQEKELIEHQRTLLLTKERDEALRRNRIAEELHDSVGHGLTTIIALLQGVQVQLDDVNAAPAINDAVEAALITAKRSLDNARQALHALNDSDDDTRRTSSCSVHTYTWDDIHTILYPVQQSGVIVEFRETGTRSDDSQQADICFRVTRESVTNAVRHAADLSMISIEWDHCENGTLKISVQNDGINSTQGIKQTGQGLQLLTASIATMGGSLTYDYDARNRLWTVSATIPQLTHQEEHDDKADDCG